MATATKKKVSAPKILGLTINQYMRLSKKEEQPLPELRKFIRIDENNSLYVQHPLVFEFNVVPGRFAVANHHYRTMKAATDKAMAEGNWNRYFLLIRNPYRLEELKKVAARLTDAEYWEILADAYMDTEILSGQQKLVRKLLSADRPRRELMMTPEERASMAAMPDELRVYRGYDRNNAKGWSWTLDAEVAKWFANRWKEGSSKGKRRVAVGTVSKETVLAYFDRRNEHTILVDPELVNVVETRILD